MTKNKPSEVQYLKCPFCGHDRFQRHERGKFPYQLDEDGNYDGHPFEVDQVACQCLKCLSVSYFEDLLR